MFRTVLCAVSLVHFFASSALSQTLQFEIGSLDDATQTRLIVDLMATNGVDIDDLIDQIPGADVLRLSQFDYQRYYEEEVLSIRNAPTLWRVGELVSLHYSSVAQLENYDFNEGVYRICVPTMFVPINTSPKGVWPPNVQIVFAPSNSTPGNGARAGERCDPDPTLWDYVGKGLFDFNYIRIKMNSDQAEQLHQQSLSSTWGQGIVDFSVTCIAGPGTINGAYCSVEDGFVGSGTSRYPIDRYDVAAIRASEEAAVATAADAEAERVRLLPEPIVSDCASYSFATQAGQHFNCKVIVFSNIWKNFVGTRTVGPDGQASCLYVLPEYAQERVEWEWIGVDGVRLTPIVERFPINVAIFELAVGETYSGFTCGYSSISIPTHGESKLSEFLAVLGDGVWAGQVVIPRSLPEPFRLQVIDGEINVFYIDNECSARWTVVSANANSGLFREFIDSGRCIDGGFIRAEFRNATQLNFEWRGDQADGEPRAWAVLQLNLLNRIGSDTEAPEVEIVGVGATDLAGENGLLKQLFGGGAWYGSVSQPNSTTPYSVNLKWGEGLIVVDYPELACGGVWEFTSKVANNTWLFTEKLNYGVGRCVDGGEVLLALSQTGVLRYEWARAGSEILEGWADLQFTAP